MKWIALAGLLLLAPQSGDAGSLIVELQGGDMTVDRRALAQPWLPLADSDAVGRLLDEVEKRARIEPANAYLNGAGAIVAERHGVRLDRAAFEDRLLRYFYAGQAGAAPPPLLVVPARVDSELLADLKEKPLGRYVTYYNMRNRNRSHNIALAARAIDSVVVFPGEKFSFNRTVGQRTAERGYKQAPVIVRGELSEGIGGGICQVSSTLFNAADGAGLQITARYSHSRHVPYVRPGRDATVSWQGPDLVFRNPYNQPVLLRAYAGGGRMVVSVYSTDRIVYEPRRVPPMSGRLPAESRTEGSGKAARPDKEGYPSIFGRNP